MPVGDPQRTGLLRFTHQVKHAVRGRNIEITIDFAATVMGVAGHRIPDASGLELREAKNELTALNAVFMHILKNRALIGLVAITKLHAVGIGAGRFDCRMRGMSRIANQVKRGWISGGCARENHLTAATPDVEAVVTAHFINRAVHRHRADLPDIDHPEFATLAEKICLECVVVAKRERGVCRDHAADDGAVEIGVNEADLAGKKKIFEKKACPHVVGIEDCSFAG